ncbi:MAG: hypothetical protein FJ297_06730 [Planctomycetes bacterium]|nr:hypothetical protein [Planctomycetota bacterium]
MNDNRAVSAWIRFILAASVVHGGWCPARAQDGLRDSAVDAMRRAVSFYHGQVASHGGYVYRYGEDLLKREGEGKTEPDTVWVQPPGTPAVGLAFVEAYERTGDAAALAAARDAGECLVRGQLVSGGWTDRIDFAPESRNKTAYRVDPPTRRSRRNWSTLDDDKSQSAIRMLMRLDQVQSFRDARIHESVVFALESLLGAQSRGGGWPQGFQEPAADRPVVRATYPESWPRTHPGGDYRIFHTFNDNAIADTIETLLLAERIYGEPGYREAAIRAGEFILLAQMPEPQPAWAQQYDFDMHPVWARKFEPPAVSGGESQGILRVLMRLYEETGERRFLDPIPKALDYLERSALPDGRLARFYELSTNRPLYFTRDYRLTYEDTDLPTHYGFKVENGAPRLRRDWERLAAMTAEDLEQRRERDRRPSTDRPSDATVRAVIAALDARGAWVEDGRLRYHGAEDATRRVIDSATFIRNLDTLSRYLASEAKTKTGTRTKTP